MAAHLREVGLLGQAAPLLHFANLTLSGGAAVAMRGSNAMCTSVAPEAATRAPSFPVAEGAAAGHQYFLSSLCGVRKLGARPEAVQAVALQERQEQEVAASVSHLVALYEAAHSTASSSPYALVVQVRVS